LAFVSKFALQGAERGIPCEQPEDTRRELAIVTRTDRSMSPATVAFMELLNGTDAAAPAPAPEAPQKAKPAKASKSDKASK
jgi:hypothetical protein